VTTALAPSTPRADVELPRLLVTDPRPTHPLSLVEHLDWYGALPRIPPSAVLDLLDEAGLTGRGGAAFPVGRKWRAVAGQPGPCVVVANAAEGEPLSAKDKTLLMTDPHLTLDGLQLAAATLGAGRAVIYLHRHPQLVPLIQAAVRDRERSGVDRVRVEVVAAPPRFVAGEESAVASRVSGGLALPRFKPPRVFERGVSGRPTLVQNTETLAHVALIARYGAGWFRSVGPDDQPGSMLFTVSGAVTGPRVLEAPVGTTARELLAASGGPTEQVGAVLLGGYHGTWIRPDEIWDLPLHNQVLRPHGWAVGAGVVAALPASACGLNESARVVRYLADESAGQCGPCAFGLPAVATAMEQLPHPGRHEQAYALVKRWAGMLPGRGACHHPDGTVRFVRTALDVFAEELELHAARRCTGACSAPVLPTPSAPRTRDDWR
jgi:NADH:ubiquinone oxidoreductase subunit F (NADH-binding)